MHAEELEIGSELAEAAEALARAHPQLRLSAGGVTGDYVLLTDLADPGRPELGLWLRRTASLDPGMDRRTEAAYLLSGLCFTLGQALGGLYLSGARLSALSPASLALRQEVSTTSEGGASILYHVRFVSPGRGADGAACAGESMGESIENLHTPLIEALFRRTRLSRAAQWRLAADGIGAGFLGYGKLAGEVERALAAATAVVKRRGSPFANDQLHFIEVSVGGADQPGEPCASEWFRIRGGCCRFYTTTGGEYCTTCVLRDPAEREARLRDYLRRKALANA